LSLPQPLDGWVVGRAFQAAVPAQVVVDTVAIGLAVFLIVLVVIAHQVVEGEAVVAINEIDAIDGQMAAALIYVGTAS
jgi:hypothetical protein